MEIIEKQTIKEVPVDNNYGYGYGKRDINGKANAGLTLGIIGTALGAWALCRIENTPEGKELLSHQLKVVKRLKNKIIDETNREMEMFRKFREFSKQHPEVTYEEFIKANM